MPPLQVSADARTQLAILGREKFEFRCFPDDERLKAKSLPQRFVGAFDEVMHSLRKLNDTGYGIFFQVNASDGKGNKTANITSAPCYFVDLDGAPRDNINRLGLMPHLVTVTSPEKFHAYWQVADIPLGQFKSIQQRLARLIDSDKSVCDLPRVMRLAGFLHQKDPENPFLVSPENVADHPPFSFDEFLAALGRAEAALGLGSKSSTHSKAKSPSNDEIGRAQRAIEFLVEHELVNLGEYLEWFRVAAALKHSFGDDGWQLFHQLSAHASGYQDEENCRRQWDAIGAPSEGAPLTIASYIAQAREAGWRAESDSKSNKAGGLPKNTDPAAYAVELAETAGDKFWLDQEGKPHVSFVVSLPDGREVERHAAIDSFDYSLIQGERFYKAVRSKVLSKEHARLASSILEHRARESGIRHVAALRVGEANGSIYVDLGSADGRAIEIDRQGWRVIDQPPVRFVRGSRGELPIPEIGGTLAEFERHFNLSLDDLRRFLGFLVGTFNTAGSFAILLTDGEQGAGKSILNDKAVSLVDPPRQPKDARMSFNPKEQDLHLGAMGVHVPYFDNVSSFSADGSDALCRMSTGGGSGSRKLYTDNQYNQVVVIRPIIVTCIGTPTSRPDLLSRSVRITALSLAGKRRTERAVMREFEADRPRMIGFLLSCVSLAIRNRQDVEDAVERGDFELPRMADFAEFVEGAAEMLGLKRGEFSALLGEGQSAMQTEAVLGHPVGAGLMEYFSRRGATVLDAPAREIIARLRDLLPHERYWPAPNTLRKALSRLSVGLQALGIEWEVSGPEGHDNVAKFRIRTTENFKPIDLGEADQHASAHF